MTLADINKKLKWAKGIFYFGMYLSLGATVMIFAGFYFEYVYLLFPTSLFCMGGSYFYAVHMIMCPRCGYGVSKKAFEETNVLFKVPARFSQCPDCSFSFTAKQSSINSLES